MKRILVLIFSAIASSINLNAQARPVIPVEKGIIILKNNDTMNCFIEFEQVNEKEVALIAEGGVVYQTDLKSKRQLLDIKKIKSVQSSIRKYENITAFKQELLFKLVINGSISLYEHPKLNIIESQTGSMRTVKFGPKLIDLYAIKTPDSTYIIKSKKDIKSITQLFDNCPESKSMIENKSFNLEELEKVIKLANDCK
jgi:hypothetical protein